MDGKADKEVEEGRRRLAVVRERRVDDVRGREMVAAIAMTESVFDSPSASLPLSQATALAQLSFSAYFFFFNCRVMYTVQDQIWS